MPSEKTVKDRAEPADLDTMGEPALRNWDDAYWDAEVEKGLRSASAPAASPEPGQVAVVARWLLVLGAGVGIWSGAIYGLLRLLSGPFG